MMDVYNAYSKFLVDKYGQKVYKIPVNLPVTCPNRVDSNLGCTFCGEKGAGFDNFDSCVSIKTQIKENILYIGKKYKAEAFIAYFQNFTNTFLDIEQFEKFMNEAIYESVVEFSVSTRPDCVNSNYLDVLKKISDLNNINITIELGLQTVNYKSLKKINRGHSLAEFIDAVNMIKPYGFEICTHLILNLPWDDVYDSIECAKFISSMKVDRVKLHALYIEKNTEMARQYENGEFEICTVDDYKNRVTEFLCYLSPQIVVERLIGRAPKGDSLFANWNISWWKIRDEIVWNMEELSLYQGCKFNYLGGCAVKRFFEKKI